MLERHDIQGVVLSGYGHLDHAAFTFLKITDAEQARAWLASLLPNIMTAKERPRAEKPPNALNLAISYCGLSALQLSDDALCSFPIEFQEGMAFGQRPHALGDTEGSAPDKWCVGGPNNPPPHLLLLYYTGTREDAQDWCAKVSENSPGCCVLLSQYSDRSSAREPFGFRDGISQPAIEGVDHTQKGDEKPLKVGEFVLGYKNEYDNLPKTPTIKDSRTTAHLPEAPIAGRRDLGKNGSYLVYRQLSQDVQGFWSFLEEKSRNDDGTPNTERMEWMAAKMVGRWKSGAPLTLAPDKDDPALAADNARINSFCYTESDSTGEGCPHGAHIRRANPRDSLVPSADMSLAVVRRHRIMRRGRPGAEGEAAIYFLVINADIENQFEFVQQTWINSGKFDGLYDNKDPLAGDNGPDDKNQPTGEMIIPACPFRERITGIPRFVTMRGGEYFFVPGMKALNYLLHPEGVA
jgi:Dyp-type peroxidase family